MTLLSSMQNMYKEPTSNEQPLNQCENLEEIVNEIAAELPQTKWIAVTNCLKIDPDKLHLVTSANQGDLQRQKSLGLLCWVEDEAKNATFEKLINALVQVDAKSLAGDLRNLWRIFNLKRQRPTRKLDSLQTQYYSMQFTQYPQVPKSGVSSGQWRFTEMPHSHFMYGSPAVAFYPSKSVPSQSDFDLTSSVSVQGAKMNLLHREAWAPKPVMKPVSHRPATISGYTSSSQKRALGKHKRSSSLEISTSIKTAIPLSRNQFNESHPEEIQEKIADKLFDYLLNTNGSKEMLSVIASLESIDGLTIRRLRRGSLVVETNLHKASALKSLIRHFENGQLNDMFQEFLISDTALKMAGAFAISLETNIDRKDLEAALKNFQDKSRIITTSRSQNRSFLLGHRSMSPPRARNTYKSVALPSSIGMQNRVTSVPASRSVMLDLSPSVRTVNPKPRGMLWRTERGKVPVKSDHQPGVVFSTDEQRFPDVDDAAAAKSIRDPHEKNLESEPAPPPSTPDVYADKDQNDTSNNEDAVKVALEDLNKKTTEAEEAYSFFDNTVLRRLVDLLKKAPEFGIDVISHVGDLRKYSTMLRQNDDAETAQLVEEYVKVTETLDQIHRDVISKIWLKVSDSSSASAKSHGSSGSPRRSPLRNRVTQSIEIWRRMQDPEYNFSELETKDDLKKTFTDDEIAKYGGLLSHIPALLSSAKTCHQLLNHYMQAP